MTLLRLVQEQIQLGVALPWNVRDEAGNLLLAQGKVVTSEQQRDALLERGAFVDANEVKAIAADTDEQAFESDRPPSLFELWARAVMRLELLLKTVHEAEFTKRATQLADHIRELTARDPDIAIYLTVRQDIKRALLYGVTHSLHTATVCCLISDRMGWNPAQTNALTKAALTMNISIIELQGRLAAENSSLTEEQRAELQIHPAKSVEILTAAGVQEVDWLATVAHHHERPDGTGYPKGAREVPELAVALRHADVFLAKISPRKTRPALPIQQAARDLFKEAAGSSIPAIIIKEFGIYPPGNFVKLKSGERAVVIRRSANAAMPLVASVTNQRGEPVVSTLRRDTSNSEYAIVSTETDSRVLLRMPPERLYGLVD